MLCLIRATGIEKRYGERTVLSFPHFVLYEGDRVGIVGANGAGKSTLLGILNGDIAPDAGSVQRLCAPAFLHQFPQQDHTRSGGENRKQQLLQVLAQKNTVLFADEPTANLDSDGVQWVRRLLQAMPTFLLVSHDRALLDAVCNQIVEIRDGALHTYAGNYSFYEEQLRQEQARRHMQYEQYRRKKAQLETALQTQEQKAAHMRKAPARMGNSEARLHKGSASERQKKARQSTAALSARLERLQTVERPKDAPALSLDFSLTDPPRGKHAAVCEGLTFSYGEKTVFYQASFTVPTGSKIAVCGKNGTGKTTLLRLLHQGHPAIRLAPKWRPGYLQQGFEDLQPQKTVLENALENAVQPFGTVRDVLAGLLFRGDAVHKPAAVLSGGERVRLSLARLVVGAYNALLLDEPTNYLDVAGIRAVEQILAQYPGTLLVVSHDERFLSAVTRQRVLVADGRVLTEALPEAAAATPADKMRLEMRRIQVVAALSGATPAEKDALERELAAICRQLGLSAP